MCDIYRILLEGMKLKQTLVSTLIIIGLPFLCMSFLTVPVDALTCGGVETSVLKCDDGSPSLNNIEDTGIWKLLISILSIITAGVGVVAVGGMVYGGVLYTTARGKPEQTKKAITVISNVGIGLIMYALMWAFLNYMIPGGVFS